MSREKMKIILSYYNIIKLIFMMRTTKSFILWYDDDFRFSIFKILKFEN